jgi:hypothetical protein
MDAGDGINAIGLNCVHGSVNGSVALKNGAHVPGVSVATISATTFAIKGGVNITSTSGTNIASVGILDGVIGGGVTIIGGTGDDNATINGPHLFVAGITKSALGAGTNVTGIGGGAFSTKGLSVSGGAGNDVLSVTAPDFYNSGGTVVNFGNGNNVAAFTSTSGRFGAAVTITAGTGDDIVTFGGSGLFFGAGISTSLGAGVSATQLSALDSISIGGSLVTTAASHTAGLSTLLMLAPHLQVDGSIKATFADGANAVNIGATGELTVRGGVSIVGGNALNNWSVAATALDIGGAVSMRSGNGGSVSNVLSSHGTVGSISIIAGSGVDSAIVSFAGTVAGAVNIGLGSANGSVSVSGISTGLRIGGSLTINNASAGGGADGAVVTSVSVAGSTTISLGAGGSTLSIADSVFNGFVAGTGSGADTVLVDVVNAGIVTIFRGAAVISLGAGIDSLTIGSGLPLGRADFRSAAIFDGGADLDTLTNAGTTYIAGQPLVTGF